MTDSFYVDDDGYMIFPFADGNDAFEIDIDWDYVNCIVDRDGIEYDVIFRKALYEIGNPDEIEYEKMWLFDWKEIQNMRNVDVYDMFTVDDEYTVQGRVAIRTTSRPYYVMNAENAPENSAFDNNPNGAGNRDYIGVGINLFAFAAMLSKEQYGKAELLWTSKSSTINLYLSWGATFTRNRNEMYLSSELGDDIIQQCQPLLGSDQYV